MLLQGEPSVSAARPHSLGPFSTVPGVSTHPSQHTGTLQDSQAWALRAYVDVEGKFHKGWEFCSLLYPSAQNNSWHIARAQEY